MPSKDVVEEGFAGKLDKLKEYIKNTCRPVFHPVGTAAMLPEEDGGVVDSKLKVYGTANLRVVRLFHNLSVYITECHVRRRLTCRLSLW